MSALSLHELAARLGGEVFGDADRCVQRVAPLESATPESIAFLAQPKYRSALATTQAGALLLSPRHKELLAADWPRFSGIWVDDPYLAFAKVAQWLDSTPRPQAGVHSTAVLESPVPESVHIGAHVWIGPHVQLGEGVIIEAGCVIGAECVIGANTRLYPNVTLYHGCQLGERGIVHAGAVIGSDGFGNARRKDGSWEKIPQTGRVVIGDDVEIGANTTIDRGALDDTVIADGVRLDNQIQIAHNVRIGKHTAIAGCVGIAGSTVIGERCMIGGQAGIIGHLHIADDVFVSAGTLITKSIHKAGHYTGSLPVQTHADWVSNFAHLRHLDALVDRVKTLEKRLQALESLEDISISDGK